MFYLLRLQDPLVATVYDFVKRLCDFELDWLIQFCTSQAGCNGLSTVDICTLWTLYSSSACDKHLK